MCRRAEGIDGGGHGGRAGGRVGHVGVDEDAAQLVGDGLATGVVDVGQDDVRAARGEMAGHALADAVAPARDECDLACDVHAQDRRGGEGRNDQSRSGAGSGRPWTTLRCWIGRVMAT